MDCLEKNLIEINDDSKIGKFVKQRLKAYFESLVENTENFGVFEDLIEMSKRYGIGKEFLAKRGMMQYPKQFKQLYLDQYADICVLAVE